MIYLWRIDRPKKFRFGGAIREESKQSLGLVWCNKICLYRLLGTKFLIFLWWSFLLPSDAGSSPFTRSLPPPHFQGDRKESQECPSCNGHSIQFSRCLSDSFYDSLNCSPPSSSVHGISQARILECIAISFSRGSSWSKDQTYVSCIGRWVLNYWSSQGSPKWQIMHLKWKKKKKRNTFMIPYWSGLLEN